MSKKEIAEPEAEIGLIDATDEAYDIARRIVDLTIQLASISSWADCSCRTISPTRF